MVSSLQIPTKGWYFTLQTNKQRQQQQQKPETSIMWLINLFQGIHVGMNKVTVGTAVI